MSILVVLGIVAPLFGLILLGYVAGWRSWLPAGSTQSLNAFVVRLALPALLFHTLATTRWAKLWHPGFILAFTLGIILTFLLAIFVDRKSGLTTISLNGLGAAYSNAAFVGLPLCLSVFGSQGALPSVITIILVVSALFAATVVLVEYDLHRGQGIGHAVKGVAVALVKNPMLIAPVLGGLWMTSGAALPLPLDKILVTLGAASTPCALVNIGLFLAENRGQPTQHPQSVFKIVALKLVAQPAITALLVLYIFKMPPLWSSAAILISALPTGTGPFMIAELYRQDSGAAARVILLSTILSVFTLTALLLAIGTIHG